MLQTKQRVLFQQQNGVVPRRRPANPFETRVSKAMFSLIPHACAPYLPKVSSLKEAKHFKGGRDG